MRTSSGRRSALLACLLAVRTVSAQDVSALLFQAKGMAGSVVDATGCKITYVVECTDQNVCETSSDLTKTITQNGASSFEMHYTSYGDAGASFSFTAPLSQSAAEICQLYGTTLAYCTLTGLVAIGSNAISSTSTYAITQEALLSYGQVPITAGPAKASASVSSCYANGNEAYVSGGQVTPGPTTGTGYSSFAYSMPYSSAPVTTPGTSNPTPTPTPGLSTAAKAGIGAGVGVVVLGAIALIVALVLVRRRKAKNNMASPHEPPPSYDYKQGAGDGAPTTQVDSNGQRYELYQPQVKYELPAAREVQEVSAGYDGWQVNPSGPRYELH